MTLEEDHGWIEKREYYWETDVMWLIKRNYGWTGLNAIGMVCSTVIRVKTSETTQESRNPIISISEINNFATSIRRHLSIENQLHRHLDVSFNEEGSHARKDNFPLNLSILCKQVLTLLSRANLGNCLTIKRKMSHAVMKNFLLYVILCS